MKRVVIVGRGAAGKSTVARRLADITGLPVIEVDKLFWRPGLIATPREQWVAKQEDIVAGDQWIIDGDLGAYDAIEVRLRAADTIIFWTSHLSAALGEQFADHGNALISGVGFWRTEVVASPILWAAIASHAPNAALHVFRGPKTLRQFVADTAAVTRIGW